MEDNQHPCHRVFIDGSELTEGKLYTYREGRLKATVEFIKDLSDTKYYAYHLLFKDGKYAGREFVAEITREPVGYWGVWSIHDHIEPKHKI